MAEKLFKTREILESFYLFDEDIVDREFQQNYDWVTSPDFPVGKNEEGSAFVQVERGPDGEFTYESGIMITSRLPGRVIDEI